MILRHGIESARGSLVLPGGAPRFSAVIALHEWWGLNEWVLEQTMAAEMTQNRLGTYSSDRSVVPLIWISPSCSAAPIQYFDRKALRMLPRSFASKLNQRRS